MVSTVPSQWEGPGFSSQARRAFLCGAGMFTPLSPKINKNMYNRPASVLDQMLVEGSGLDLDLV